MAVAAAAGRRRPRHRHGLHGRRAGCRRRARRQPHRAGVLRRRCCRFSRGTHSTAAAQAGGQQTGASHGGRISIGGGAGAAAAAPPCGRSRLHPLQVSADIWSTEPPPPSELRSPTTSDGCVLTRLTNITTRSPTTGPSTSSVIDGRPAAGASASASGAFSQRASRTPDGGNRARQERTKTRRRTTAARSRSGRARTAAVGRECGRRSGSASACGTSETCL